MSEDTLLLPCPNPWCTQSTPPVVHGPSAGVRPLWFVAHACGVNAQPRDTEAEAITAWNTRPTPPDHGVDDQVAQLKEANAQLFEIGQKQYAQIQADDYTIRRMQAALRVARGWLITCSESATARSDLKTLDEALARSPRGDGGNQEVGSSRDHALSAGTALDGSPYEGSYEFWPSGDDAADARRYRYLKEYCSYLYPEDYVNPQPREFGIHFEHQDSTTARPSLDATIDAAIAHELARAAQEADDEA